MKLLPPLSRNTCPIKQRSQRNRSLKAYPKCKITIFRTLFDSVIYILPQRYSQVRRQTACLIKHKFISSKPLSSYLIYKIYSSRAGPGGQSVVNLIRHACILWGLLYYVRRRNHEESCYHLFCIADTAFLVQPQCPDCAGACIFSDAQFFPRSLWWNRQTVSVISFFFRLILIKIQQI